MTPTPPQDDCFSVRREVRDNATTLVVLPALSQCLDELAERQARVEAQNVAVSSTGLPPAPAHRKQRLRLPVGAKETFARLRK